MIHAEVFIAHLQTRWGRFYRRSIGATPKASFMLESAKSLGSFVYKWAI